jgi:hypothetical protein
VAVDSNSVTTRERRIELSYLTGRFMTEHLVRVNRAFDGDLTAAIVLATIAQHNIQRYYEEVARSSAEGLDRLIASGEHAPHLRPCNAFSVSAATGIPRETVRRKVKRLREKGWLTVGARGQLAVALGIAEHFAEFDRETIRRFETTARDVLALIDGLRP